ncbi:hypothetical protein QUA70_12355 [Microcoleus sp. LAD1_D5]|uniref:hypothetical protein n=1 Tax=unclassified Microcoleus TaxID=2642155 RepID=UPI002FD7288C
MQVAPIDIFPGYTLTADGLSIAIPLAALPGLTATEANATTGNAMEVVRQVVDRTQSVIGGLAPTARPTKAAITKAVPTIATGLGVQPGTLRQAYNLTFDLTPTALEPASESTP